MFTGNPEAKNAFNYFENQIDNGENGDSYWGLQNNLSEDAGNTTDYQNQWGIMNVLSKRGSGNIIGTMRGISSEAYLGATGSGNVPGMQMFNSYWSLPAGSAINFDRLTGVNVGGQISNSFAGTVDEIRGINVGIGSPSGLVDDKYGLYVQNITNGNNSNYAIYTNNGDVGWGPYQY